MRISKELLKGSTVTLVLSVLSRKEMYGYEMVKEFERVTEGVFSLNEGTLYPILHSLESEGLVEASWVGKEGTRQRKYYRITKEGRHLLKERRKEWVLFRTSVEQILAGANS
jgi:PadR family transcriptional regulator, regulatory protein PadR